MSASIACASDALMYFGKEVVLVIDKKTVGVERERRKEAVCGEKDKGLNRNLPSLESTLHKLNKITTFTHL